MKKKKEIFEKKLLLPRTYRYYQDQQTWTTPPSLLVGFHGYSHNGRDFLRILKHLLLPHFLRVSLEGSHHFYIDPSKKEAKETGYSFFTRGNHQNEELKSCLDFFLQVLEALKEGGPAPQKTILLGFSQGASLALYLALHAPIPLDGLILYSGFIPESVTDEELKALNNLPIFLLQGEEDEIFTQTYHLSLKERLLQFSNAVTQKFVRGSHRIHQNGLLEIEHWIQNQIPQTSTSTFL
jgi:phospholipase/carboxylesterase